MQDLQADLAARCVHGLGNDAVLVGFFLGAELGGARVDTALVIGRDSAGDHQADATAGALGKIGRHALETPWALFKASVHRAHQGAVAQRGEAQVEWCEQVRITVGSHGRSPFGVITECGYLAGRRARRLSASNIKQLFEGSQ
ncbi:hypothetical protein D3C81_1104630 [compost metagenome]